MPTWSVYIVRCADTTLYTGIAKNVPARVRCHNDGKGAAYTRNRKPVVLVWTETKKSESAARQREAQIKCWTKLEKEKLVKQK